MNQKHSQTITLTSRNRQSGQAMIYGLCVMAGGLAAMVFLFNTGQLIEEKTKLVNTADAVALSAGVMHARALNFDAYTNRALMANEVLIAQSVSIASWTQYLRTHTQNVPPLQCNTYYSEPARLLLVQYAALCLGLTYADTTASLLNNLVQKDAKATTLASEAAKKALQSAQLNMLLTFIPARARHATGRGCQLP